MGKSKFVRTVSALLMLLALTLPVAPAAASVNEDQADVHAANVSGSPTPGGSVLDVADCTGNPSPNNDFLSRYFITVRSTSGLDVTNAVGRLQTPGFTVGAPLNVTVPPQTITMSNGDFESQAQDGQPASGCVPAVNDGHANDLSSPPTNTVPVVSGEGGIPPSAGFPAGTSMWFMVVTAGGFVPQVIPLTADDTTAPCTVTDQRVCLISMGTINLSPLSAPAGRGTLAGSIFSSNGSPLDGATVVVTDASGLVHTRTSGTNCDGVAIGGPVPTGFYCVADSTGDRLGAAGTLPAGGTNDGLGLPVGPATMVVVNNTLINCVSGLPGTACGLLPATVTVSIAAGTVVGQDVTLQNKFTPAAGLTPAAGADAFGYVINGQGAGIGGIVVTATAAGGFTATATCPSPTTGVVGAITVPVPGTCTQTGLWIMTGLPVGTAVTFTVSGSAITAANVRPSLSITRTTTAAGTWIDPNWIIVQSGPPTGAIPLPVIGSALIRGTVTDSQGQPFTGAGAFVLLYRNSSRSWASGTAFAGAVPSVRGAASFGGTTVGFFPNIGSPNSPGSIINIPFAASALDAGGNYCFGSGNAPTAAVGLAGTGCPAISVGGIAVGAQPPLLPDSYIVTVIDDRPTVGCVAGFQPPAGGIGPAPCGNLPWSSQPVIAQADRVTTVNVQLQAKFSPGAPALGGAISSGVFGVLWDAGVPGGRPIQGGNVYAVAVPPGSPLGAQVAAVGGAITPASLTAAGAAAGTPLFAALAGFVAQVQLSGPGIVSGAVISSTPAPGALGGYPYQNPTFPGSDQLGMYRILGLIPATTYAIITEVPGGYNDCAPNDTQVGVPVSGSPFILSGILQPTSVMRCAVLVTAPPVGTWAAGADFAFAPQALSPLEPGETDRRLVSILPFVGNGAPTAMTGGWDLQTNEIRVVNAGAQRAVAEIRFYASDGLGGAAVLAGTQTADLVPGGARTFRAPDMPGGFIGWAGVWTFDADGPGGLYGSSDLVVESMISARNAGNAAEAISGVTRAEINAPAVNSMIPLVYRHYGGTENKWSSLLVADNLGDQAPVVFVFRTNDTTRGDARACRIACTITKYANRGGMITMNLGDDTDPDVALLPDGTFTVDITAGGASPISGFSGILPGSVQPSTPGGYIAFAINVSVTGKMMTEGRSQIRQSFAQNNLWGGPQDVENTGILYAPLVFNNSNGWNSGIAISASNTTGSTAVAVDLTFYNEDGGFVGEISNRLNSGSPAWYVYLPSLQFLPDKYRGTAIMNATSANGTTVANENGISLAAAVYHVNYDRNAAISYDAIGQTSIAYRTDAQGQLPCVTAGFTNCAWAAEIYKTGTASAQSVVVGTETGVRLMNVDPLMTGAPTQVIVVYIDDSGIVWDTASQRFTIPPFGVHSLFPLYDSQIPEVFRGTMRIMSTGNYVIGVANTVDYTVTDHDASGSYNLTYNTGRSR